MYMQQEEIRFRYVRPESCLSRGLVDSQEDRDTQEGAVARRTGVCDRSHQWE